jgi:hypothetical protein
VREWIAAALTSSGLVLEAQPPAHSRIVGNAEEALHHLREIMGKLKLTVNEDKTQICKVPEGEFKNGNGASVRGRTAVAGDPNAPKALVRRPLRSKPSR